ncbi:unnamed protein product [Heligmosomoides polygyrus]|uniref:Reverse transcriptase domain-containing protein n=1 Tax=Heligmosomoides polygyrus TaxID=6339 RepID=A0A183FQI9_HELPZ|nr:unnamed protein product [Heligmosomoides polygyrus]
MDVVVQLSTNQCVFVSGCGTVDAVHAIRLLLEKHREKQKPAHFAFLDLEKAFDCVPRGAIRYALRQHGIPEELIEWVRILFSCPISRVRAPAGTSMEFPISVGVHQGSALSPLLFVVVMDAISRDFQMAAPWTLLYADDVVLACENKSGLERQAQAWCDRLALFGLKLNVKKAEYFSTDVVEHGSIKINGAELSRVTSFKHLGSTVTSDGILKLENSGLPGSDVGAECWPFTKEIESRLSVMETKMLRWTAGVTRLDRIRNDTIRQRFGVAPIAEKLREARLRWYGHVLRSNDDTVRKISLNLNVLGKRPRERPKQRWLDALHLILKMAGVHPDQAFDRENRRHHIRRADLATTRDRVKMRMSSHIGLVG